ncbi:MAG TPA: phytanoyl-CoA dioxygenase, partial [Candidatus Latescibacteria bacterium]|nr:phytanoyl-CoA dioxygenase [Candidatus Latescibacterota bacterium]
MRCEEALAQLNASQDLLSHDEKQFLDEQGYLPLPEIMNHAQVDALRTRFDELVEDEGENAGTEV